MEQTFVRLKGGGVWHQEFYLTVGQQRTSEWNTICGSNFGLKLERVGKLQWSGQADSQLSASFPPQNSFLYILNSTSGLERTVFPWQWFLPISHLLVSLCVFNRQAGRQALPWVYNVVSLAPAYKVRRNAERLVAVSVCVRTGDIALTTAVTSVARCVWTCALACVQETAATPSVLSASAWHRTASYFLPPNKLKHQRYSVSPTVIFNYCANFLFISAKFNCCFYLL